MVNKRQHRRFIKRCDIAFFSDDLTFRGMSRNFSLNGLFIKTNRLFAKDKMLGIEVSLPDGSTSELTGKVKWSLKTSAGKGFGTSIKTLINGMGVEIIAKDAYYLHFIRSLLS